MVVKSGEAFADTSAFSRARAKPLAPDDRRDAIAEAVLPLIEEFGPQVTSRQLAEAAGVAEGTLFRAFGDKESLIAYAVGKLIDPLPLHAALRGIDPEAPVEQKLTGVAQALRDRFTAVIKVMTAFGMTERPSAPPAVSDAWVGILRELFARDADRLTVDVDTLAHYLRLVCFASALPPLAQPHPFTTDQLVGLVTGGVLRPPGRS